MKTLLPKSTWYALGLAAVAAAIIFLIRHFELFFLSGRISTTSYVSAIGLLFLGVGLYLGLRLRKEKQQSTRPADLAPPQILRNDLLTPREAEILGCIARGWSNQEIAENLFVSENTVKKHISNIYTKLGVNRRVQAIGKAKEFGILS